MLIGILSMMLFLRCREVDELFVVVFVGLAVYL